jgi:hypothetical protein
MESGLKDTIRPVRIGMVGAHSYAYHIFYVVSHATKA